MTSVPGRRLQKRTGRNRRYWAMGHESSNREDEVAAGRPRQTREEENTRKNERHNAACEPDTGASVLYGMANLNSTKVPGLWHNM